MRFAQLPNYLLTVVYRELILKLLAGFNDGNMTPLWIYGYNKILYIYWQEREGIEAHRAILDDRASPALTASCVRHTTPQLSATYPHPDPKVNPHLSESWQKVNQHQLGLKVNPHRLWCQKPLRPQLWCQKPLRPQLWCLKPLQHLLLWPKVSLLCDWYRRQGRKDTNPRKW